MTAGIAIASWKSTDRPLLVVAADTRVSRSGAALNDASVKTLEVEDRVALVSAGEAFPVFVAAEMTRTFLRAQTAREPPQRMGFFDIARLLCYFQSRAARSVGKFSETLVAGYFRSGVPGLARILVNEDQSLVSFLKCEPGGAIWFSVGVPEAQRLLMRGLETAHRENRKLVLTAIGLLEYMMRHDGETFAGVGGQISIGACDSNSGTFKWPALKVGQRTYWRGVDVTTNWSPSWDSPVLVEYDESWCARIDQTTPSLPYPADRDTAAVTLSTLDVANVPDEELFRIHSDPAGF